MTFSLSYVVIVTRGRLFAIGRDYEEAAMDLGASPADALRRVLLPLLAPAILSSFFIVFAISIDDFVISQFLCAQDCTTIPIKIYSAARNAGNPSLNALATIMMLLSLLVDHGRRADPPLVQPAAGDRPLGGGGLRPLRDLSGLIAAPAPRR